MLQIIPNWHPIFVHFTVALLSLTVIFSLIGMLLPKGVLKEQCLVFARWSLWLGTAFAIITALAGWDAYNTVAHDTPSHAAMTEHRNWAIAALTAFVLLSLWSIWDLNNQRKANALFALLLLVGGALLVSTAWRGGELVYRYGLGVMSLPQTENDADGHEHAHVNENEVVKPALSETQITTPVAKPVKSLKSTKEINPHNSDGHAHDH